MPRPLIVLAALALALALAPAPAGDRAPVPAPGELNEYVLRVIETYPRDGTHAYWWPKGSSWAGTTRDIVYRGVKIAEGDPQGRCYCCGLTFEVFMRAYEAWCAKKKMELRIADLEPPALEKLRADWYCAGDVRTGPVAALVPRGLGVEVARAEDARPGDFAQLWRKNGSGHSVIFIAREGGGIKYWSTQTATNGIGYHTERYETIHIARAGAR